MTNLRWKISMALGLLGSVALFALRAPATEQQAAKDAEVQNVLDRYRSFRPDDRDLAIFQLDWVASLPEAREKAAREQRPILLIVVTNSYGNMYTGHC
jgi:hypothetical protein